jgi:eukaryotic-like serine/threonine-protein kinase
MRPQPPAAPACMDELWQSLRAAGLLDDEQLSRLASTWAEPGPVHPRIEQLVQAGVLTGYQAEQILAGKPKRLRLGPYRILDRIGSGGGGHVYKAEHVLMKRLVALKVLRRRRRQGTASGSAARQPRRAELETAGRLSHPHIVATYDAARWRGRLVLVLEYVDGIDLERLINEAGPLPVPLACEVVRQTALALAYLHGRKLVHCDVKPANLLLLRGQARLLDVQNTSRDSDAVLPDGPPLVKLVDLGLACRAGAVAKQMCGTLDYIAPERGLAAHAADIRGDLYSLGCTFYHLLTGRVPFPGGSWTGKLLRHRLEEPEPVRELRPEVPAEVAAVVARLMARDPEARYPEPSDLIEALERLQPPELEPVQLPAPAAALSSPRRFVGLGPWFLMATILTGSAVGGVARLTLLSPGRGDRPARSDDRRGDTGVAVSGMDHPFANLADAVAAAPDGATLTLHGPGPFRTWPLNLQGKSLTLRGAPGARPLIERLDVPGASWDALFFGDRPLTLEGLDLHAGSGGLAPLVSIEGATIRLLNCTLRGGTLGPLVALRRGQLLDVEDCRLTARCQALAVEVEPHHPCRLRLAKSHIEVIDRTGPALLLWSGELGPDACVPVELDHSTILAARIVACRSLAGPVALKALGCRFSFQHALVSFDGYRGANAWRGVLRWCGRDNRYESSGAWLRIAGEPGPVWSESAWEQLWTAR